MGILRSAPDWFLLRGINLPTAPLMPRDQSWERIFFISPTAGHPNPPVTQLIPRRSEQTASVILMRKMLNKERKGWACGNRSFGFRIVAAEQMSSSGENWVLWNLGWHSVIRHLQIVAWYLAAQQLRDLNVLVFSSVYNENTGATSKLPYRHPK